MTLTPSIESTPFAKLPSEILVTIAQFLGPDCFFHIENHDGESSRSVAGGFFLLNRKIYALGPQVQKIFLTVTFPEQYGALREVLLPVFPKIPEEPFGDPETAAKTLDASHTLLLQLHTGTETTSSQCKNLIDSLIIRKRPLAAQCISVISTVDVRAYLAAGQDEHALFALKFLAHPPVNFLHCALADRLSQNPHTQTQALNLIDELPSSPDIHNWQTITQVYTRCNRLDDALFTARFLGQDERPRFAKNLAEACQKAGQPDKAQHALALIESGGLPHFYGYAQLISYYIRRGEHDHALRTARFMTQSPTRNDILEKLAGAFEASGQPDKAALARNLIRFVRI